jgi:tRNA(adenine34) deaminase
MSTPDPVSPLILTPEAPGDRVWMARALEQARVAGVAQEVPVGAVLVRDGKLVAEGRNLTRTDQDPTAHAEVVALRAGGRVLGDWRLTGCTLYVTLEPCAQCAGALVLARVDRLVFAASDPKAGMVGSLGNLVQDPRLNHRMEVTAGVLAEPAGRLLKAFFQFRRRT